MTTRERRKHARVALAADVDLTSGDNFYSGRTRDISVGGLFIDTPVVPPIGTSVVVRLTLGEHTFALNAEVMWALDGDEGQIGVGVRFVDLSKEEHDAIAAFMTTREPMEFEMNAPSDRPKPPPLPEPES